MDAHLKIPYENGKNEGTGRAPAVKYFVENRTVQMRYTRKAVESGNYRAWITQVTDKELEEFINTNKERIEKGLKYKTFGPTFHQEYFWRNALYELELLYRSNNGTLSQDLYDVWADEMIADKMYWEGKLTVALADWHKHKNNATPDEKSSFVTPYY